MLRVSVDVGNGSDRFGVTVQAESIREAVGLVERRYPESDIRVEFPLNAENFFIKESAARSGIVSFYKPDATAA